jgi:riboflavin synthase
MFTGIIKAKGVINAMEKRGGDVRLSVRSDGLPWSDYEQGESIAVNGVCLTAVALHEDGFDTDVSVETLDVTALGGLGVGSPVNLEPAISLGERLGGHLVSACHRNPAEIFTLRGQEGFSLRGRRQPYRQ